MKNFNVKQSGSEVKLEEVNPYDNDNELSVKWMDYEDNKLILTSIDPNIKVGQVIREDQLEPDLWQYKDFSGTWHDYPSKDRESVIELRMPVRQVAKLKQPVHETPKSGHDLETCTEKEEKGTGEQKVVILKSGSVYDNRLFDSLSQARNYVAMRNPKRKWKKSDNDSEMVCALYGTKFIFQPLDQHK